MDQWAQDN
jgi:hypothetical protein